MVRLSIPKPRLNNLKLPAPSSLGKEAIVLLAAWTITGLLAIFVPILKWNKNRKTYYNYYGIYNEYEQQQRQYENGENNGNYYYPQCAWYQWNCRKQQYYYRQQQNGGGGNGDQIYTPDWYRFIGGTTEEDRRFQEEMGGQAAGQASGATKFVYIWTLVLFLGLLLYGMWVIMTKRAISGLIVALAVFAQFSLLNLILLGQGVILTDNRDLEDSVYGWQGQLPVLMVYSDFWYILHCLIFCIIFAVRAFVMRRVNQRRAAQQNNRVDDDQGAVDDDDDEEGNYESPAVYKNFE